MDTACVICNIIQGKQSSYIIYEDDLFISFLDIHPLFPGHSLVSTKEHIETFYDLPAKQAEKLTATLQRIGNAITTAMNAEGSFIGMNTIVSQSIPHFHTHIVPRKKGDGLKGFFWPRVKYESNEELIEVQKKIIRALR